MPVFDDPVLTLGNEERHQFGLGAGLEGEGGVDDNPVGMVNAGEKSPLSLLEVGAAVDVAGWGAAGRRGACHRTGVGTPDVGLGFLREEREVPVVADVHTYRPRR